MRKAALAMVLIFLLSPAVNAQGIRLGVGGFGGLNIPIVQDDQSTGSIYGVMARIRVLSIFVAEPNVTFGSWGEPDPVDGFDLGIEGSSITSYGIDATIGGLPGVKGFKPYGVVGAGIYSIENEDTDYDESKLGYSFGFGFLLGLMPAFDVDIRAKAVIAPQEDGSKKAAYISGGLTYYFKVGN